MRSYQQCISNSLCSHVLISYWLIDQARAGKNVGGKDEEQAITFSFPHSSAFMFTQSEMFEWQFGVRSTKKMWEREGEGKERRVLRGWKWDRRGVRKSREGRVSPVGPHHITVELNCPWRFERFNMTEGWKSMEIIRLKIKWVTSIWILGEILGNGFDCGEPCKQQSWLFYFLIPQVVSVRQCARRLWTRLVSPSTAWQFPRCHAAVSPTSCSESLALIVTPSLRLCVRCSAALPTPSKNTTAGGSSGNNMVKDSVVNWWLPWRQQTYK